MSSDALPLKEDYSDLAVFSHPENSDLDPDRYVHTEYRERSGKVDGVSVKFARIQIFENLLGDRLALILDPKTGKPRGEIIRLVE